MSFRKISTARNEEKIVKIKCNPALDVVALLLQNGSIDLFRFLNWKKIATLKPFKNLKLNISEEKEKIINFEWAPNGKYIAIIYNGFFTKDKSYFPNNLSSECSESEYLSSVAVFDISTHEQVLFRNCSEKITKIVWRNNNHFPERDNLQNQSKPLPHDTLEIPYIDLFTSEKNFFNFLGYEYTKLKPETKTNKFQTMFRKTEKAVEMDLSKFEREIFFQNQSINKEFIVQTTVSESGSVDFYAFGLYKIMSLKFNDLLKNCDTSQDFSSDLLEVEQLWNSANIHELYIIFRNKTTNGRYILSISLSILEKRHQELFAFMSLLFQIDLRAEFLDRSLQKMSEIWQDLCSCINRMLSDYLPKNKDEPDDPIDIYSSSKKIKLVAIDFMQMMLLGNISNEMEQFLSDMSETDFKKLALNVEIYFVRLLKFNSEEIQSKLYQLICFLNILKAISLEKFRFADLFLDVQEVNCSIRNAHAMLIKTTQMEKSICDSMKKLRSFIRWLSNCSVTYAKDNCDSDTRLEQGLDDDEYFLLNSGLTNSDLHLVMEFLRDNSLTSGFRFPEVEFFFKTQLPILEEFLNENQNEFEDFSGINIPYRAFVAKMQKDKFLKSINEKLIDKQKTEKKKPNNSTTLEESTVMMDIISGETTLDDDSNISIKESELPVLQGEKFDSTLKFEDFNDFEQSFYDDNDDVDKFDTDIYKDMGLYAHLVQIYDNFIKLFQIQTCEKLGSLQTELFKNNIDRIFLTEIPSNFSLNYEKIQQFYDETQSCQFLACVCKKNRELFVLQKHHESDDFNHFSMQFHFNNERQTKTQLWIRDFKFFNSDILTVILSEFDHEQSIKNPQDATEYYDDDVSKQQISVCNQESGQFLLQIRYQSLYFASQGITDTLNTSDEFSPDNSLRFAPQELDICLDSKITRKWLTEIDESEIVNDNIELRELAKGTVDAVFASRFRNIVAVVADSRQKVTFYDVADSEEIDE